jgi:hypothetical protein
MNQNNKEKKDSCEFPYIVCYVSGILSSFDEAFNNAILLKGVEGLISLGKPQRTVKWVKGLVFANAKELPLRFLIGESKSEPEKFQKEAQAAFLLPRGLVNTMINYYRMPLPNTTESSRGKILLRDMVAATVISELYYTQLDDTLVETPQDLFKNFLENEISDQENVAERVDAFIPNYPSAAWSINFLF